MASFGNVVAVVDRGVGTTLAVAATAGDEVITVDDVSKLTWPKGGIRIGSEWHTYLVDAAPDESVDVIDADEEDEGYDEQGTLTIVPLLTNSYDVDEPVIQYQQSEVKERIATVLLPDQQEQLVLQVPRGLWDRLPAGIRQRDLTPETVALEDVEGEWVMTDVVGEAPTVNAFYVDPNTLPATASAPAGAGADNLTYFSEAWANPGRVKLADDSWASAIGTSVTATVTAHNTGFQLPGTAANDSGTGSLPWSDVNNIKAKSGGGSGGFTGEGPTLATSATAGPGTGNTQRLQATNFNFAVPPGATITGITVEVTRGATSPILVFDAIVKLIKAGSIVGTDKSSAAAWPGDWESTTYGGDLWGTTWTPAQVNASDFGVSIQATHAASTLSFVDAIRVRVNYTTTSTTDHRSNTHFLMATGFNFGISNDALITAVTVEIERHASDDSGDDYVIDNEVRILSGGDVSAPAAHSAHWPLADQVETYSGQLWGLQLYPEDVNSSTFGVWLSADVNAGVTAFVDQIKVSVSYVGEEISDMSTDRLLEIGSGAGVIDDGGTPPPGVSSVALETDGDVLLTETSFLILEEDSE